MNLNIVADENIPATEHFFGALGRVQRVNGRALQGAQLQDADILLVRSVTRVDEALLAGTSVKFVGTATSGVDHVDRDYLARRGVGFAHAPGSNANSVVEYVLAAIAVVGDTLEQLLGGGVVGIVGFGHIGKALAARLKALGICYRIYDPWLDQDSISNAASLDEILCCDVVTLHPELTTEQPWPSLHLLGSGELRRLGKQQLLINASRGPVVDNAALLALLDRGLGPLTVLDVWEGEPDISAPLLQQVKLGTAHIAGYSLDGKLLATRMLSEAAAKCLQLSSPPSGTFAGTAEVLAVPGTLCGAALLRFLLQSRYDICRDDTLLRTATLDRQCGLAGAEGFDHLRKTYRDRRELAGSLVAGVAQSSEQDALVRALGCILTGGEKPE